MYWQASSRPLVSLVFVAPMLVIYEGGILLLGPGAMRNGADVWLRQLLDFVGFGQYVLLPVLTCGILLAWHHVTGQRWNVSATVLRRMLAESTLLSLALVFIAYLQGWLFATVGNGMSTTTQVSVQLGSPTGRLVGFFGAGLYEEVLFRLMVLPCVIGLLSWAGEPRNSRLITAVCVSSLMFSAAHYRLFTVFGESFTWFSFLFRMIAGMFFAMLFLYRGFGITAWTHTLYDVIVGTQLVSD
jgi:hypothetical protein